MKKKKGKKGFMAIKVDLEKAYDRLDWEFLEDTLLDIRLSRRFTSLIMACVTTCSMQILWNGSPTEKFKTTRGIRQGDPLSPYLFVLCIERLAHKISYAINLKEWKPIFLRRNGPAISHLFFANDLILFSEASVYQANIINKWLEILCQSSG